jgi:uncharacterized RDD family membrane protein YckC
MSCSVNHATLATKFCPVCGGPAIQAQPPAPSWTTQPAQTYNQPQWQPPAPQQQWQQQQPAQPHQGAFAAPLASRGKRLGGVLLDGLFFGLSIILAGLPYFIWLLIVMKDGQTPGKQVLKMKVYGTTTNRPVSWGHMAIRTILIPWVFSFVYLPYWFTALNYGYLSYAITDPFYYMNSWYAIGTFLSFAIFVVDLVLFFSSPLNQRISDRWAKTVVLDETQRWGQRY